MTTRSSIQKLLTKVVVIIVPIILTSSLVSCSSSASTKAAAPSQTVTVGAHIISIQTGTDFDQQKGVAQGITGVFRNGETVFVVFTVKTSDKNAQIVLKLFQNHELEDTSQVIMPKGGTHVYAKSIDLNNNGVTGTNVVEIDYNGVAEAQISFTVI